ncbi:MAG TPA: hypothetical protein VG820_06385, partial [Fimbriimonadaceae bacterium]|nr:hypothetical protein [Fimbriimonadaceae bacterium]
MVELASGRPLWAIATIVFLGAGALVASRFARKDASNRSQSDLGPDENDLNSLGKTLVALSDGDLSTKPEVGDGDSGLKTWLRTYASSVAKVQDRLRTMVGAVEKTAREITFTGGRIGEEAASAADAAEN